MFLRRNLIRLPIAASVSVLGGCAQLGLPTQGVTLEQAQAYVSALAGAVSAGATAFLTRPPTPTERAKALVTQLMSDIQMINAAVQAATETSTAQTTIQQILGTINQLMPLVSPYLGAAAQSISLAIAVLGAFVQNLAPPAHAPLYPPRELRLMALRYHQH